MPPDRTFHKKRPSASTSAATDPSSSKPRKPRQSQSHPHPHRHARGEAEADALPGVQKLKAALRQTRRLLAKDNLAADVRVATERRLKSQEAEIAQAELARKERTMAVRYHKVKFFERQKVTRKIAQATRELASHDADTDAATAKPKRHAKARRVLETTLLELRVDLNYILHYPKTQKYISLFPPSVRGTASADSGEAAADEQTAATDARRAELRARIRGEMEAGRIGSEPEREVGKPGKAKAERAATGEARKTAGKGGLKEAEVKEDDFFGEDEEGAAGNSQGSDGEGDAGDSSSEAAEYGLTRKGLRQRLRESSCSKATMEVLAEMWVCHKDAVRPMETEDEQEKHMSTSSKQQFTQRTR